jgi:hypothetical protein
MTDTEFRRPSEGRQLDDRVIYRIVETGTDDLIGEFYHDGAVERPADGETISLVTSTFDADTSETEHVEEHGRFRVEDVSHRWELIEIHEAGSDDAHQMFDVVTVSVSRVS